MLFSIIIPVRKFNDFLKENIANIKNLEFKNFEVIIITDEKEEYDFGGDLRFITLVSGPVGPSEKRNIGARAAKGEVLVFIDDDANPAPDWLTEANKIFSDSEVYALGGPEMTPKNAGFKENMSGLVLESRLSSGGTVYRHIPQPARKINDFPSVNLFVRKEAFHKVGGFCEEFWPGEDTKLCLDLIKLYGRDFEYSPKTIVYHHRRNMFAPHFKQISRYGQHRGLFARIFPETSRKLSYFMPSFFILSLILGPISFLFGALFKTIYFSVVILYLILLILEGLLAFKKVPDLKTLLYVPAGIFLTHIIYGVNFIIGFIKKPKLKLKAVDLKTGNYSEG